MLVKTRHKRIRRATPTKAMAAGRRFSVLGAGSWGTALALVLARNGHDVTLWGHDPALLEGIAQTRSNPRYLSDIPLPSTIYPEATMAKAVSQADSVLIAVPSAAFASTLTQLAAVIPHHIPVIWATKGLDAEGGGLLHQLAEQTLTNHPLAILSGPSFAREVAQGLPTAVALASIHTATAEQLARAFHDSRFRVYTSTDVIGVELGGAVKNVLAIATGIADGLAFGANARAGLITRGLAEVRRLGQRLGAEDATLTGLAGMGDLILTCTDDQSRNRRFGLALGHGASVPAAEQAIGQVVEGVRTARELAQLAHALNVEMPICQAVEAVINERCTPLEAARELMMRRPKPEFGSSHD